MSVVNCHDCQHNIGGDKWCSKGQKRPKLIRPDILRPLKDWGYRKNCDYFILRKMDG